MDTSDELRRLAAQPRSVCDVLALVDDPNASSADLARIVETDPVLSLKVIGLANGASSALRGTVTTASRAVLLLGFTTVRALAAGSVCALLTEHTVEPPPGFWPHTMATAFSCAAVARHVGVNPSEAFTAGLLHDIGHALLFERDPHRYAAIYPDLVAAPGEAEAIERAAFGTSHEAIGAQVLEGWNLPRPLVRAVRDHHVPLPRASAALTRVLIAGEALAELVWYREASPEPTHALESTLAALSLAASGPLKSEPLVREVQRDMASLQSFLDGRR